jgi:4a-hydroxytetrahydrobiopterin dehydratase
MPTTDGLTIAEFEGGGGTEDWAVVSDGATAFYPTGSLAASATFVAAIAAIDGIEAERPDIDVRPAGVWIRLVTFTDDWGGMTRRDLVLARAISVAARSLGLVADRSQLQSVDPIVVGANDPAKVIPFWRALLGYVDRLDTTDEDIVDPRRRGPGFWFEPVKGPREGRNRMHCAVWLPYELAEARLAAAIAAGGTVIYERAPTWWTLVDPEGNEADISTTKGRD